LHSDYRDGIEERFALINRRFACSNSSSGCWKASAAIKLYRELTGAGLIEAKTIVESL
jgi:ribosomal protein L7/L12